MGRCFGRPVVVRHISSGANMAQTCREIRCFWLPFGQIGGTGTQRLAAHRLSVPVRHPGSSPVDPVETGQNRHPLGKGRRSQRSQPEEPWSGQHTPKHPPFTSHETLNTRFWTRTSSYRHPEALPLDRLNPGEKARLEEHLSICAECRHRVSSLAGTTESTAVAQCGSTSVCQFQVCKRRAWSPPTGWPGVWRLSSR